MTTEKKTSSEDVKELNTLGGCGPSRLAERDKDHIPHQRGTSRRVSRPSTPSRRAAGRRSEGDVDGGRKKKRDQEGGRRYEYLNTMARLRIVPLSDLNKAMKFI